MLVDGANEGVCVAFERRFHERDWNTGKLLGRLAFDRGIFALTYGDHSLWVTVGASPPTLVRVDPATRRPIGRPTVATQRSFASAFGSGAVWVTGSDDGSLARVNPATDRVDRVKLGGVAAGVIVSGGSVWVALYDRIMVIRVDPRTLSVLHTTNVGNNPAYLAAAGGLIWVVNQGGGTVTRIDVRTGQTVGLPIRITADNAITVAITGRSLWVTSFRPAAVPPASISTRPAEKTQRHAARGPRMYCPAASLPRLPCSPRWLPTSQGRSESPISATPCASSNQ